jgi:integrase
MDPRVLMPPAVSARQSPLPGYHVGRPPGNKGRRYPADPPTVEEIVAVMRAAGSGPDAARLRALVIVLWRAGLRISEALALAESDMDARRGAILVRHGKGNKRREVGMDIWAWEQLQPWQEIRMRMPVGAFFCVIHGPTAGRPWEPSSARRQLERTAAIAGVRGASPRTSFDTSTPSRWPQRASRSSSYSGNWGMPTSG